MSLNSMWIEYRQVFDSLSQSPFVRAIVLSGAGPRAFTTGLDVQAASQSGVLAQTPGDASVDGARVATMIRRHILDFQDCISSVEKCEKPVICAMHGYALGLGIDIATSADVRVCSSDTKFAVKEVDIGLAADIGTLSRLPKVVGNSSWVKDVSLSARIFGAEEAMRVGFVSGVYEGKEKTLEAAIQWASLVAEKSPVAVQGTKDILNWSRDHNIQDGGSCLAEPTRETSDYSQVFGIRRYGIVAHCSRMMYPQPCKQESPRKRQCFQSYSDTSVTLRYVPSLDIYL